MDIIKTNIEIFTPTDFLLEETKHKLSTYLSNIYENTALAETLIITIYKNGKYMLF